MVVGLCGGIGAGKSTVARLLEERGAVIVDVDVIGHRVLDLEPVRDELASRFGAEILTSDGAVDRAALSKAVFSNDDSLKALEAISHPLINFELANQLEAIASETPDAVVVLDMAVLVETGLGQLPNGAGYSTVVVVEASPDLRLDRLGARGVSPDDAQARIACQATDEEHRAVADYLLVNESSLVALAHQVEDLWRELTRLTS